MRLAPRCSENFRKFADRTSQIKLTNVSDKHGDVIKPLLDKNLGLLGLYWHWIMRDKEFMNVNNVFLELIGVTFRKLKLLKNYEN